MRTLVIGGAIAATAALAGCGDSTGPLAGDGTFTLRSIDGQPLPVLVDERRMAYGSTGTMATVREHLDAMRLVVRARDVDTLSNAYRIVWDLDAGEDPAPIGGTSMITANLRADSLCFRTMSGPGECGGFAVVRRTRDEIVIRLVPGPYPSAMGEYRFVREE